MTTALVAAAIIAILASVTVTYIAIDPKYDLTGETGNLSLALAALATAATVEIWVHRRRLDAVLDLAGTQYASIGDLIAVNGKRIDNLRELVNPAIVQVNQLVV